MCIEDFNVSHKFICFKTDFAIETSFCFPVKMNIIKITINFKKKRKLFNNFNDVDVDFFFICYVKLQDEQLFFPAYLWF